MARNLSLVSFLLFFVSGCAVRNDLPGSETQTEPVVSNCPTPAESVRNEPNKVTSPVNKNPSKQKIQLVQELLKTSGFNPGPIDGILGSKTRSALYQYQSGCAMLKDLLGTSDKEVFQQTAETQAPKVTTLVNKKRSKQKIRLVQERLKTSGFDPGPIDGMLGPKTRSALLKYQAFHGLSNSGTLDEKTLVSLFPSKHGLR